MATFNDNQLEELASLIQETAHLLSSSPEHVDRELFQASSHFDWQLDDESHCQRHNVVRKFLQLMDNINTPQAAREFSEEEVLAQLRLRIQPLFALSKEMTSQRQSLDTGS